MNQRIYKFDNIKAILIFLVVFAHMIEKNSDDKLIYDFIYCFHMPLFIFITGYFATYKPDKIFHNFIFKYIVFQTAYLVFDRYVLANTKQAFTYTKPVWILWYLFACIFFYCSIPFLELCKRRYIVLIGSVIVALLVGLDNKLGYQFSAARILGFYPFFVAGYYAKSSKIFDIIIKSKKDKSYNNILICCKCLVLAGLSCATAYGVSQALAARKLNAHMLYFAYSYESEGYSMLTRLIIMTVASAWILTMIWVVPDKKMPLISSVGNYTLSVFLLHGFIVQYLYKYNLPFMKSVQLWQALLCTVMMLILLGNKWVYKVISSNNFLKH